MPPPSAPTDLSGNGTLLTWTPPVETLDYYELYHNDGSTYVLDLSGIVNPTLNYSSITFTPNTNYSYYVTAVSFADGTSDYSNGFAIPVVPTAPTDLSGDGITLTWTPPPGTINSYTLFTYDGGVYRTYLTGLTNPFIPYTSLPSDSTFEYAVKAVNNTNGISEYSTLSSAITSTSTFFVEIDLSGTDFIVVCPKAVQDVTVVNLDNNYYSPNIFNSGPFWTITDNLVTINPDAMFSYLQKKSFESFTLYIQHTDNSFVRAVFPGTSTATRVQVFDMSANAAPFGQVPQYAIDDDVTSWWQSSSSYNASTGVYEGTEGTTVSSQNISGDWIQVDMSNNEIVRAYTILPRTDTGAPNTFTLAGSTNGTTWTLIDSPSDIMYANYNFGGVQTDERLYRTTNNTAYRFYRIIVQKTGASFLTSDKSNVQILNMRFYTAPAVIPPRYTFSNLPVTGPLFQYTFINYLGGKYKLTSQSGYNSGPTFFVDNVNVNPTSTTDVSSITILPLDLSGAVGTGSASTFTAALFLSIGRYTKAFYPGGRGQSYFRFGTEYTTSSFQYVNGAGYGGGFFQDGYNSYGSTNNVYDTTSGEYTGTVNTVAGGQDLSGEWIQVDLSDNEVVNCYSFALQNYTNSPKKFWFVGSTDASTWTLLDTQEKSDYINTNDYISIPFYNTTAYRYYRFITNVVGNSTETGRVNLTIANFLLSYSPDASGNWLITPPPPPAPTDVSGNGTILTWTAVGGDLEFYDLYSYDGATYTLDISGVVGNSVAYTLLETNTTFQYAVKAFYTVEGFSDYSTPSASISIAPVPPTDISGDGTNVFWTPPSGTIDSYDFYTLVVSAPAIGNKRTVSTDNIIMSQNGKYCLSLSTSGNVKVSSDYGNTFTNTTLPSGSWAYAAWPHSAISYSGQYMIASKEGVTYVSSNYGATWTQSSGVTQEWSSLSMSASGQYVLGGVNGGLLYLSSDYGATFTQVIDATTRAWYQVVISGNGVVMGAIDGNTVYISTDSGANWSTTAGQSIGMSYDGKYIIIASFTSTFVKLSTNYGSSFTTIQTAEQYLGAVISSTGQYILIYWSGGALYSNNFGVSFSSVSVDLVNTVMITADATHISTGGAYLYDIGSFQLDISGVVGTSVPYTSLTEGTYQFSVKAINNTNGTSDYSLVSAPITISNPTPVPTDLSGNGTVLTWTPPAGGADSYKLYYYDASVYTLVSSPSTPSESYTNLPPNTNYQYAVIATKNSIDSDYSSLSSAISVAPLTPTDLSGDGTTLTWTPPVGGTSTYNLYAVDGTSVLYRSGINTASILYTEIFPGTTAYAVSAVNAESVESALSSSTAPITVDIGDVPNGSVPGNTYTQVLLEQATAPATFTASLQDNVDKFVDPIIINGATDISGLVVNFASGVTGTDVTTKAVTFVAIANGTTLTFPQASLPGVDQILYLPAANNDSYTLSINSVPYVFTFSDTTIDVNGTVLNLGDYVTIEGQLYRFIFKGSGGLLGVANAPPSAPVVTVPRPLVDFQLLTFFWNQPLVTGGSIDGYHLYDSNIPISITGITPNTNSYTLTSADGLQNGVNYSFKISASNTAGEGPGFSYRTVQCGENAPSLIYFQTVGGNIAWENPTNGSGAVVKRNLITATPINSDGTLQPSSSNSYVQAWPWSRTRPNTNISTDSNYQLKIQAWNDPGYSSPEFAYVQNTFPDVTAISGLKLRLDAFSSDNFSLDETDILSWTDQSGLGNNATQGTATPTYDSANKAVVFNRASSQFLNLPDSTLPTGNSPFSYFTVLTVTDTILNNSILSAGASTQIDTMTVNNELFSQTFGPVSVQFNTERKVLLESIYDGVNTVYLYVNGILLQGSTGTGRDASSIDHFIGSDGTNYLGGSINEIVVYDRFLSNKERQQVEYFLKQKWFSLQFQPTDFSFYTAVTPNPCAVWLDMADTSSYTTDASGNITAISNKGYATFNLNTIGRKNTFDPVLSYIVPGTPVNGKSTVYFSPNVSISDNTNSITASGTDFSYFFVGKQRLSGIPGTIIGSSLSNYETAGGPGTPFISEGSATVEGGEALFYNGVGYQKTDVPTNINQPDWETVEYPYLFRNVMSNISTASETTFNGLFFNQSVEDAGWTGDFCELLVFNGLLSAEQIKQVEAYLIAKWGLFTI